MVASPASTITKAASKQTYYTIRFLVDRERVDDAYRAYGYFRWVDDILDAAGGSGPERRAFLERQKSILDACYRGAPPQATSLHERLLVELIAHDDEEASGLQTYLRQMMQVMDFDARRRGRLISQAELNEYTRWLATAVTEAMHYFIGHHAFAPAGDARYLAVSAAHITHMLRDTFVDLPAGYYNIPREVLEAHRLQPDDVHREAYRAWVRSRVLLARNQFKAGLGHFAQAQSARCRLAGLAYAARFAWLLDTIEREGYCLRPDYRDVNSAAVGIQMAWRPFVGLLRLRRGTAAPPPVASRRLGRL